MEQRSRFLFGVLGGVLGTCLVLLVGIGILISPLQKNITTMLNDRGMQLFATTGNTRTIQQATAIQDDVSQVVESVNPAVVNIVIKKSVSTQTPLSPFDSFFFSTPETDDSADEKEVEKVQVGAGSGFVVSSDGMIVTNRHVASDETATYTVVFADGKEFEAKVVARDTLTDLAILKIDAKDLTPITLGDSDVLKLGQSVIAIGNTLGTYQNTVTRGIVSGLSRSLGGEYTGLIQTDAAINEGNSGGPLLNAVGEVIGVNTAVDRSGEGIGFAIPINEVKFVIESVEKNGKIVRPGLGVRYVSITKAIAQANDLAYDYGAYIRGSENAFGVVPGSSADKAGIQEGDIILEVDGQKVTADVSLPSLIRKKKIGDTVKLKVFQDGEEKELTVTLAEIPTTTKE